MGIFPKCSLHHVCFHRGFFNGFSSQKINKIKIKIVVLHLCVCLFLGLRKPGDFTVSEGHRYPLVYLYNILGGRSFHPSVSSSVPSSIHPSSSSWKKMMMEEEEEGSGRMAALAVYRNVYVIQSCSLWKTPVVLQFAKSYKLIFKN